MPSYRILDRGIKESFRVDEQRQIIPTRVITYMVGTHGPFTYTLDAKDFNPTTVGTELERQAQDVLKLYGQQPGPTG